MELASVLCKTHQWERYLKNIRFSQTSKSVDNFSLLSYLLKQVQTHVQHHGGELALGLTSERLRKMQAERRCRNKGQTHTGVKAGGSAVCSSRTAMVGGRQQRPRP